MTFDLSVRPILILLTCCFTMINCSIGYQTLDTAAITRICCYRTTSWERYVLETLFIFGNYGITLLPTILFTRFCSKSRRCRPACAVWIFVCFSARLAISFLASFMFTFHRSFRSTFNRVTESFPHFTDISSWSRSRSRIINLREGACGSGGAGRHGRMNGTQSEHKENGQLHFGRKKAAPTGKKSTD
jgi:hypothetical protein